MKKSLQINSYQIIKKKSIHLKINTKQNHILTTLSNNELHTRRYPKTNRKNKKNKTNRTKANTFRVCLAGFSSGELCLHHCIHIFLMYVRVRTRRSGVRAHNVAPNDLKARGATAAIWVKCCIVAFRTRSWIIVGMLEIVGKICMWMGKGVFKNFALSPSLV